MENAYLVYLLQGQIHSVFSVFGGWKGRIRSSSVFCVFVARSNTQCIWCICKCAFVYFPSRIRNKIKEFEAEHKEAREEAFETLANALEEGESSDDD